jgi:hypothetical protein
VAAEGTFHFLFSLVLCLLGSLRVFGIGRFLILVYQKSSAANTKHPQSASRFASLACFTRTSFSDEVAPQRASRFKPQTARVVGAAGNDFWYSSMKRPPHLPPVPYPARNLDERKKPADKQKPRHRGRG